MRNYDLLVIGGGLIGSAIAWGAARSGADTALLDEGDTALRASRGNFGLVWLQGKGLGHPSYMHWSLLAGRLWPLFADTLRADTGIDVGWRGGGGVHFCLSEAELNARHSLIRTTREQGGNIHIRVLDRRELRDRLPTIGPEVTGASISDLDGEVNPLLLLRALQLGLQMRGGALFTQRTVERITPGVEGGYVMHTTGGGRFRAKRIALCAGLSASGLARQIGLHLPLSPERGQIVVTDRLQPFLPYPANAIRQTQEGTVLLGSTHDDASFSTATDVSAIARLCRTGVRIFPALKAARVIRAWGSVRILTPDGLPVYEESAVYPGAFVVTCHSGVTLASVHGLELGHALAAGGLGPAPSDMRSSRFDILAH